jgi:hypothetical protein
MAAELKCQCGKVLTDSNVCPLPRGRACAGPSEVVPPWIVDDFDFDTEDLDDFG